jgi:hypothetical protein
MLQPLSRTISFPVIACVYISVFLLQAHTVFTLHWDCWWPGANDNKNSPVIVLTQHDGRTADLWLRCTSLCYCEQGCLPIVWLPPDYNGQALTYQTHHDQQNKLAFFQSNNVPRVF